MLINYIKKILFRMKYIHTFEIVIILFFFFRVKEYEYVETFILFLD